MRINPLVLDLSHYDVVQSLHRAQAAGIAGIIHKASEGPGMSDKFYDARRAGAKAVGMLWGAYHFLRLYNVAVQVEQFLSVAKPDDATLMALDHEDPKVPLNVALEFLHRVHAKVGRYPLLYSGFLIKEQLSSSGSIDTSFAADVRLWLAQYGSQPTWPKCWERPFLWQFTGDGEGPEPHAVPGIVLPGGNGLDINSYEGDAGQLAKEWVL